MQHILGNVLKLTKVTKKEKDTVI